MLSVNVSVLLYVPVRSASLAPMACLKPIGTTSLDTGAAYVLSVSGEALIAATDAHAYPATVGTPALREAIAGWFARRRGVPGLGAEHVLPTIGSKEFIAGLPFWLGLGAGDVVVHPAIAYPTYAICALAVGATPLASDDPADWPEATRLIWLNSPGNPDGRVLGVDLPALLPQARELAVKLATDAGLDSALARG